MIASKKCFNLQMKSIIFTLNPKMISYRSSVLSVGKNIQKIEKSKYLSLLDAVIKSSQLLARVITEFK